MMMSEVGYGTISPPKNKTDSGWENKAFDDVTQNGHGFCKYCMLN